MKHPSLFTRVFLMLCICVSLLALTPAQTAHAAVVWTVNSLLDDGSPGTLRTTVANAASGDIITFSVTGTINLTNQIFIGINLVITGPGVTLLTIDGGGVNRIFDIGPGSIVSISDMTITNGSVLTDGGGIRNMGTLTLDSVLITANVTTQAGSNGGGIMNQGVLTINDSTISNNSAKKDGGGIYSSASTTLVLNRDIVTGNMTSDVGGRGGGIAVYSAEQTPSTLNMDDTTVSVNSAQNYGGGIAFSSVVPMSVAGGILTITDSLINGNTANDATAGGQGGGISIDMLVTATLQNTTISSNSATGAGSLGGGIITFSTTFNFNNVTVAGNTATQGGGVYLGTWGALASILNMRNSIIADNTATGIPAVPDCYAFPNNVISSLGYNLIENLAGCFTALLPSDITGVDPVLGSLTNNGGPTLTHELKTGSPAIDVGDPLTCASTDQRGITRPLDGDNNGTLICDMGAFERKSNMKVTYRSVGANDGWVLESNETTNVGGTKDTLSTVFNVGDSTLDRQYRAILSFNTTSLPDKLKIIKATLKIKKQGLTGTDPFTILGSLVADIRRPFFGTTIGLVVSDFQAVALRSSIGIFSNISGTSWYSASLTASAYPFINRTGSTQFRLRFNTEDDDDGLADYMKFYSGNYTFAASKPSLIVEYYVP